VSGGGHEHNTQVVGPSFCEFSGHHIHRQDRPNPVLLSALPEAFLGRWKGARSFLSCASPRPSAFLPKAPSRGDDLLVPCIDVEGHCQLCAEFSFRSGLSEPG
jgi:hypothetical protein